MTAPGRTASRGEDPPTPWVQVRKVMGTVTSIHVVGGDHPGEDPRIVGAVQEVIELLCGVDRVFTTFSEASDIRRLARGEAGVGEVDSMVCEVADLCLAARRDTHGLFDAWWKGWFDPTGLVKGWSVERAVDMYLAPLVESGLVEAVGVNTGGDMQLHTSASSSWTWDVGIADPGRRGEVVAHIPMTSGAVATSGTGERGSHIVDPRTGRPAVSVSSATVVAGSLTQADLWATTACVAGFDDLSWITSAQTTSGLLVAADGRTRRWDGPSEVLGDAAGQLGGHALGVSR